MSKTIEKNERWQQPYNTKENLEGSFECLDEALNTLKKTISTIGTTIHTFRGHTKLSESTRKHEIYLENQVEDACQILKPSLLPEIEEGLSDIESYMLIQNNEERELTMKLQKQELILQELMNELDREKSETSARNRALLSAKPSSSSQSTLIQREIKLLESKINEKNRMCFKEEKENEELKTELEERRSDRGPLDQTQESRHKQELDSQLAKLETTLTMIKEETEKKSRAHSSEEPANAVAGSLSQYKTHLDYIGEIYQRLQQINPMASTIEDCKRECNMYLNTLDSETFSVSSKNTKKIELFWIKKIMKLCKSLLSHGKTAARTLELVLESKDKSISIESIHKEFPATSERRHHISDIVQLLMRENILRLDSGHLFLILPDHDTTPT
ncbi:hypothetical protein BY458DRAFT_506355 [Sporodiniella umbellata]|nr:hypothetical protein BY458DRAFT_506355 [Sporodiniella umbellata]